MRSVVCSLAFAVVSLPAVSSFGQNIVINLDNVPLLQQDFGLSREDLTSLIEDEIRALYGLADVPTFLRLSANAQSLANKGLGVDYASNVNGWVFGVAVAAAVDAGEATIDDLDALADGTTERVVPVAAGAQIGVMVGYTVADDLTLYANGLYYPLSTNDLDGTFYNVGVHAQYKAFRPRGDPWTAQWGGLDLTTGFELSRMFLELNDSFDASGTLVEGLELDTRSFGILELEQRAITIPIEATTNVTFLHFLTLYGGLGVDFQLGDASMNFALDTNLTAITEDGETDLGTALITIDEARDPTRVLFRIMGGAQINIWNVKIFSQVNFLTEDLTVSLAAGVRLVL